LNQGTVTAGNASQISDGAAAVVVMNDAAIAQSGARPLARVIGASCVGVDPARMGLGPVVAIRSLLSRHGLALDDIDQWEVNEAFAGQVLAVLRALGLKPDAINPDGGAVALGHPLGASGARITGDLARRLANAGSGARGVASLCIGGGMGMAVLLEGVA
jgi:acetyl-CoA C-acetyltransferase